jgi:RING finger and CHY zinc finger domain-containing protein 1
MSNSQNDIQTKIREINRRKDLNMSEKSKLIFEAMNPKKKDEGKQKISCNHYKRNCQLMCVTCKKFYPCRICHDDNEDHKIERHKVEYIKCNECNLKQKKSSKCQQCNIQFAKYYCPVCTLYDDDETKIINHCDKCGICRIGNNKHCDDCDMCFPVESFDTHQCQGKFDSTCPICNEYLKDSRQGVTVLKCKHTIHSECYHNNLRSGNYQCPICKKSTTDMTQLWEQIESYVNNCTMPDEYKDLNSEVYCNDCEMRSITDYHFVYHKCKSCSSWNTSLIRTFKF